jgi:hypothetical protein
MFQFLNIPGNGEDGKVSLRTATKSSTIVASGPAPGTRNPGWETGLLSSLVETGDVTLFRLQSASSASRTRASHGTRVRQY